MTTSLKECRYLYHACNHTHRNCSKELNRIIQLSQHVINIDFFVFPGDNFQYTYDVQMSQLTNFFQLHLVVWSSKNQTQIVTLSIYITIFFSKNHSCVEINKCHCTQLPIQQQFSIQSIRCALFQSSEIITNSFNNDCYKNYQAVFLFFTITGCPSKQAM